jgi:hypothetical protein
MISEWIVILGIIFCILVFYYSQSVTQYSLSQMDEDHVAQQLGHVWEERRPVVISKCMTKRIIWSAESLKQTRFWGAQPIWGAYEADPQGALPPSRSQELTWADILGIAGMQSSMIGGWFSSNLLSNLYTYQTEAHIGAEGLRQTYGHATAFACTQGTARCILLHSAQKSKLPPGWKTLRWKDATVAHHPLWTQVQYIEVLLRPGTVLLVPPHWLLAIEPVEPSEPIWWTRTAVHHPISWLAQRWNE